MAPPGSRGEVADLIDDETGGPGEVAQSGVEVAVVLGLEQGGDDFGQGGEEDAFSGLDGLEAQRGGEMGFSGAGGSEEMDHFGALDEAQLRQGEDATFVQRGLEGEVEGLQGLGLGEARGQGGGAQSAGLASGLFFTEQTGEEFQRGEFAGFELSHQVAQDLERAGELEAHEQRFDSGELAGCAHGRGAHRGAPGTGVRASALPRAS